MKYLADANIPRLLVDELRGAGHDVLWAWSALPRTSDEELVTIAEREGRVVITYDKGFGDLVFVQRRTVGVILLRLRAHDRARRVPLFSCNAESTALAIDPHRQTLRAPERKSA